MTTTGQRYVRPGEIRPPAHKRAGTAIMHAFAEPLVIDGKNQGTIDITQRVFQHGGEAGRFIRWSLRAITFPADAWLAMQGKVDFIEMVDHTTNRCYRCSLTAAKKYGQSYNDPKIGRRMAVPLRCWDVVDVNWIIVIPRETPE